MAVIDPFSFPEVPMARRIAALLVILAALPASTWAQAPVPAGVETRFNTYTTFEQVFPVVASDPFGNFVVAWSSQYQDGSDFGVFAQRFDAAGAMRGDEFRVNSYTTGGQVYPAVASDARGNFLVVWHGPDGNSTGVFAQRYDATGAPRGAELRVNAYTTSNQAFARVASDARGDLVVVWASLGQDGSGYGVFGQRYDATGAKQGAEFRVNTYTTNAQEYPAVAS